ncbi:maltokinase N-terminal cap-like domain-containing protein [Actinosynnema sp. NPDC004786]
MTLSAWDRTRLAAALVDWLPYRRWFAAKGRPVERVDLARVADLGRGCLLAVVEVRLVGEAEPHRYQLPLGLLAERTPDAITDLGGLWVVDATDVPDLMAHVLALVAAGGERDGVRFTAHAPVVPATPVRRITAEQSNTSVVFGDRHILKFFRRLFPGVNPELAVSRALGPTPTLPPLHGAVDDGTSTLAVVQGYAAGAVSGWDLAGTPGFTGRMRSLGEAVAATHAALADAFGHAPLTRADLSALVDGMLDRLTGTAAEAPALGRHVDRLTRLLVGAVRAALPGSPRQRVHGDLHLGQVLAAGGGWLLIDFEGEPGVPIPERARWDSPLRDVAGVLRSLDYAAHRTPDRDWVPAAEREFLAGYAERAGRAPDPALLLAHQLDKAVYEVGYEVRNRPDWVDVPLRAIERFVAAEGRAG